MAAPSKSFTVIADSSIDADSPLTEDLMTDLRDNDIHLEEWLGKDYTAATNHDHDGANSAAVGGTTGGSYIAVGHRMATGNANLQNFCRFKPDVLFATPVDVSLSVCLKHVGDDADEVTPFTATAAKADYMIDSLVFGGALLTASASYMSVANQVNGYLAFKSLGSYIDYGVYAGTGASQQITNGFQPEVVFVWRATDGTSSGPIVKTTGMASTTSRNITSGATTTTAIHEINSTGFKVNTSSNANSAGVDYAYLAFKSFSSQGEKIQVDTYTGTGVAKSLTNSAGFSPQAVFVINTSTTGRTIQFSLSSMYGSKSLDTTTEAVDAHVIITEDGCDVSTNSAVNAAAETYAVIYILGGTRP